MEHRAVDDMLRLRLPTGIAAAGAVVLHGALGQRHGREGKADTDAVPRRKLPSFRARARHVERRMRLLHRPRPDRDRAVLVIATEPTEWPCLGPGAADQMQGL